MRLWFCHPEFISGSFDLFGTRFEDPESSSGWLHWFFRSFSTRNLNLSGRIKLSLSSVFRSSIPATASNPHGFHSIFIKCWTSTAGFSASSFTFPVFGGVVRLLVFHTEELFPICFASSVANFVFSSFMRFDAFSTPDCISRRDFSSASMESHFQSLVTADLNSGDVVTAWKNASKPVSFGEDIFLEFKQLIVLYSYSIDLYFY